MWNIQSLENIWSQHICVFALLMMFRRNFWDEGLLAHQQSRAVSPTGLENQFQVKYDIFHFHHPSCGIKKSSNQMYFWNISYKGNSVVVEWLAMYSFPFLQKLSNWPPCFILGACWLFFVILLKWLAFGLCSNPPQDFDKELRTNWANRYIIVAIDFNSFKKKYEKYFRYYNIG